MLLRGLVVVAVLLGGVGVGGGAQAGQAGVLSRGADLAQLLTNILRRPGPRSAMGSPT